MSRESSSKAKSSSSAVSSTSHASVNGDVERKRVGAYSVGRTIGVGSFAKVCLGWRTESGERVAIKVISLRRLSTSEAHMKNLRKEISILRGSVHRNIVQLHRTYQTAHHIYLVMEYCDRGDLDGLIRTQGPLLERTVRLYAFQLSEGLRYLRSQSVIHRDLKPQNVLLCQYSPPREDGVLLLKIADFGFARQLGATTMAATLCGSPLWMPPEILRGQQYSSKVDLWSAGAVIFQMSTAEPPFHASNHVELLKVIDNAKGVLFPGQSGRRMVKYQSDGSEWRMSEVGRDLVHRLLQRDPKKRVDWHDFFAHPWITGVSGEFQDYPYVPPDSAVERKVQELLADAEAAEEHRNRGDLVGPSDVALRSAAVSVGDAAVADGGDGSTVEDDGDEFVVVSDTEIEQDSEIQQRGKSEEHKSEENDDNTVEDKSKVKRKHLVSVVPTILRELDESDWKWMNEIKVMRWDCEGEQSESLESLLQLLNSKMDNSRVICRVGDLKASEERVGSALLCYSRALEEYAWCIDHCCLLLTRVNHFITLIEYCHISKSDDDYDDGGGSSLISEEQSAILSGLKSSSSVMTIINNKVRLLLDNCTECVNCYQRRSEVICGLCRDGHLVFALQSACVEEVLFSFALCSMTSVMTDCFFERNEDQKSDVKSPRMRPEQISMLGMANQVVSYLLTLSLISSKERTMLGSLHKDCQKQLELAQVQLS